MKWFTLTLLGMLGEFLFAEQEIKEVTVMQDGKPVHAEAFTHRLLVNFSTRNATEISEMLDQYGLQLERFIGLDNWCLISAKAEQSLMHKLKRENPLLVQEVEYDLVVRKFSTPNDARFKTQWYLSDSLSFDLGWLVTCKLPQGNHNVLIGILDSGIAAEFDVESSTWTHHPDLPGFDVLIPGTDFSPENEGEGVAAVRDLDGHGTFVTGEMFARTDNSIGIAGLLNNTRGSIKALIHQVFRARDGSGSTALVAAAIKDLVDRGVAVINFSGGGYGYSAIMEDAVKYAQDRDVIIVAAAGNTNELGIAYPARFSRVGVKNRQGYPNVISVGASDRHDRRATFSSFGPELCFVAPGERTFPVGTKAEDEVGIVSTTPWYAHASEGDDWRRFYYHGGRGTSFAAPMVTALVGMLLSHNQTLSPEAILNILIETADRIGEQVYEWDGQGWFNPYYGYGKINYRRTLNRLRGTIVTDVDERVNGAGTVPTAFELYQNYPNPFNPVTSIRYRLTSREIASEVKLEIFNTLGQKVRTIADGNRGPGTYSLRWNGVDDTGVVVAGGTYIYRLRVGQQTASRRMLFLR